ncbi:hypothetical protein HHE02_01990 [Helicobacter heilmannii]|nr:hypothetical protein HHE02_01990 [Helicobacter heilmannii]
MLLSGRAALHKPRWGSKHVKRAKLFKVLKTCARLHMRSGTRISPKWAVKLMKK